MRKQFYFGILLLSFIFCVSCDNTPAVSTKNIKKENTIAKQKRTQALLQTQSFEYDSNDKNKIDGDYIDRSTILVPKDLAPQSKWFMFEGPVLENDLVAYRYYADSRHRFDIYGKKVPDLVMDTVSWDYHNIMDWGSDILKVGNSLGLGSPAIWYKDTLYTLSDCDEKTISIVENGDKKSMIRTTFKNLKVMNETFDLVQDWSIEAGQPWSTIQLKLTNGKLPKGMYFATGIVKHLPEIKEGKIGDSFYAMNWGTQTFHDENMGMAIIAESKDGPEQIADDLNHAYIFKNASNVVQYRFLSVWEKDNNKVKDAIQFKKLIEDFL